MIKSKPIKRVYQDGTILVIYDTMMFKTMDNSVADMVYDKFFQEYLTWLKGNTKI